ncbi:MAG: cytochrome b/b6 domain-containing protein [Deltaproteobacteria bacterium]|nr:cytochrome b/b6 domain-containing protein [Deltaproteobacteria bacterium]
MRRGRRRGAESIRRFSRMRIAEHWCIVLSTLVLFATGLSQRFWHLDFSQWLILQLGGIDNVRWIHRYTGVFFSVELMLNVAVAVAGVTRGRWEASMAITRKDFTDAIRNMRYYFGLDDHPARCDRYDYMEKFEYWTILMGGFLMVATGAVLWFPIPATRILPGEIIPAAKALHSNEALVIFLINALWHIINAVFSPEVFPLDSSIFTGYISRERMMREHPLELARIDEAAALGASPGRESPAPEAGAAQGASG